MNIEDVKDHVSLETWFEATDQPSEVQFILALRASLRALPDWGLKALPAQTVTRLETAPLLGSQLISYAHAELATVANQHAASEIYSAVSQSTRGLNEHETLYSIATACYTLAAVVAHGGSGGASLVVSRAEIAGFRSYSWQEVRNDLRYFLALEAQEPIQLLGRPLFSLQEPEVVLRTAQLQEAWANGGKLWRFWANWYDGVVKGNPLPANVTAKVAGLDAGNGHRLWRSDQTLNSLLNRIFEIYEPYRLGLETEKLKAELEEVRTSTASVAHRAHNMPPQLVEEAPRATLEKLTIVWLELDQATLELEKENPDPSRLMQIAHGIWEAVKAVVGYCASLGHTALQKSAETIGVAGTKVAIATAATVVAAKQPQFQSLVQGLQDLAKALGSP